MKQIKEILSIVGPSPSSRNHWNSYCWRNLNLLFLQTTYKNISIAGTIIKEKGLCIAAHVGVDSFPGSSDGIGRFKMKHNIVYGTLGGERRSNDLDWVDVWKNDQLQQETEDYYLCEIDNGNKTGLFFSQQPSKILAFCWGCSTNRHHIHRPVNPTVLQITIYHSKPHMSHLKCVCIWLWKLAFLDWECLFVTKGLR